MRLLDLSLVVAFSFGDGSDDVLSVGSCHWDVHELFLQGVLNVTGLEVVVVDLDGAGEGVGLGVDEPGGLPLARPEVVEASVDAADVDLQVAVLVEAEAGTRSSVLVVVLDIGVDSGLDARPARAITINKMAPINITYLSEL